MAMKKRKILILEGGGAYGLIISNLLRSYSDHNPTWRDKLHCLSGCSIGGALALAYGIGRDEGEIHQFFSDNMENIFKKRFAAKINPIACPTYSSDGIENCLSEFFGEKQVSDIVELYPKMELFIPALNLTEDSYKVFDKSDLECYLKDISRATTAAPSYFSCCTDGGDAYVDGGMIEVAPLITTVTGFRRRTNITFGNMDVLMIGCGYEKKEEEKKITAEKYESLSLLGLATDVISKYVTKSNQMATLFWGNHLGLHSFKYYNPIKTTEPMDDVLAAKQLSNFAGNWYSEEFKSVMDNFLS